MGLYNKRGMDYDIIKSLIVGLIVLVIVFYWLFNAYFTAEDIDWEICRESLIMRNSLPEKDLGVMISTKGGLDLKCKTQVITIDYKNKEKAEKIIGETISSCWYMVGRGGYKVFPGVGGINGYLKDKATPCIVCSRIHMDSEVREFYSEEANRINLKRALNNKLDGYDVSIWDYLNPSRGPTAFNYIKGWNDTGFSVDKILDISWSKVYTDKTAFSFPKYFLPERGDLFFAYSEPIKEGFASDERSIDPYMFFLQEDDLDMFGEVWISSLSPIDTGGLNLLAEFITPQNSVRVCSDWESIPA